MANVKIKDIDVVITEDPDAPNGIAFALNAHNGNGQVQRVAFNNSRHPGIIIHFNIDDDDDTGLVFQPVPGDAIWAAPPGTAWPDPPDCPADPPPPWSELVPLSVEEDRDGNNTQLIVYFRNSNPDVHFNFALRFLRLVEGVWQEVNYDPIGDGNNGLRL